MITLKTYDFKLPLRHVFSIARESTSVQPTLIVELSDGVHRGYGEATTNGYYGATLELMRASLETVRSIVESAEPLDPEKLWDKTWPLLKETRSPSVRSIRRPTICGASSKAPRSTSCGASRLIVFRSRTSRSASTRSR